MEDFARLTRELIEKKEKIEGRRQATLRNHRWKEHNRKTGVNETGFKG